MKEILKQKKIEAEGILNEPAKPFLFARGIHCSQLCKDFLRDIAKIKGEQGKNTTGKNDFLPMEDETGIEQLCKSKTAGLFMFGTENKKRPNNVILGRTYDYKILDMIELGITKYESILDCYRRTKTPAASSFSAPLVLFQGEEFANAVEGGEISSLQNLLIDMFRGYPAKELNLEAIDLALVFSCSEDKVISMKTYRIAYNIKESEKGAPPKIDLLEHGPNCEFQLRRVRLAAPNLAKLARKQPKLPGSTKTKNMSSDPLRGLVGQIHMHKQNTDKLVTRSRFNKILKRNSSKEESEDGTKKKKKVKISNKE